MLKELNGFFIKFIEKIIDFLSVTCCQHLTDLENSQFFILLFDLSDLRIADLIQYGDVSRFCFNKVMDKIIFNRWAKSTFSSKSGSINIAISDMHLNLPAIGITLKNLIPNKPK